MGRAGIEPATHGFSDIAPSSLLPEILTHLDIRGALRRARPTSRKYSSSPFGKLMVEDIHDNISPCLPIRSPDRRKKHWGIDNDGHWSLFIWSMDGTVAWEGCKVVEATSTDLDDADGLYENTGGSRSWPTERDINLSERVGENRSFYRS
jgi:hypothetical protein